VLCLALAGRLARPYDPQSCAGRSLVLLAGLTMPDWSAGEGPEETTPWSPSWGLGAGLASPPHKKQYNCYRNRSKGI